jgi:hypothetical protein
MRIRIQLFTLMRIRIELFTFMRIQVLLLLKVTGICHRWSIGLILSLQASIVSVHCPPRLYLDFNAEPDPSFYIEDPDPALKNKMRTRIRNPAFYNRLSFKCTVTTLAWSPLLHFPMG